MARIHEYTAATRRLDPPAEGYSANREAARRFGVLADQTSTYVHRSASAIAQQQRAAGELAGQNLLSTGRTALLAASLAQPREAVRTTPAGGYNLAIGRGARDLAQALGGKEDKQSAGGGGGSGGGGGGGGYSTGGGYTTGGGYGGGGGGSGVGSVAGPGEQRPLADVERHYTPPGFSDYNFATNEWGVPIPPPGMDPTGTPSSEYADTLPTGKGRPINWYDAPGLPERILNWIGQGLGPEQ
jgi:hypothetical protein